MAKEIIICDGAVISASEVERVENEVALLKKGGGANSELTVTATLHLHHDFPKVLYNGKKARSVANAEEESAAVSDGFGGYDHESFNSVEDTKMVKAPELFVKPTPAPEFSAAKPLVAKEN